MQTNELLDMLNKAELYDNEQVPVCPLGSIERAMVKVGAAHMRFLDLPVNIRNKVIAIAQMEGW